MIEGLSALGGAATDIANIGIGIANYNLQKKMFKYQKALQERIFQREDTAVQRRVSDLEAAGMSKVLAAGQGAGTGGVVSTTTPQMTAVPDVSNRVTQALNLMQMRADISNTSAQGELIKAQKVAAESQAQKNQSDVALNSYRAALANSQRNSQDIKTAIDTHNLRIAQRLGMPTNPGTIGTTVRDIGSFLDTTLKATAKNASDKGIIVAPPNNRTPHTKVVEGYYYQFNPDTNSWERRKVK